MLTKLFEFDGAKVRVVMIQGKPWWVVADVAPLLGFRDAFNALRKAKLRPHQQGYSLVSTPGGPQRMQVVNKSGLLRLIMCSTHPDAERFQDWLTDEVIPSLMEKGTYTVPGAAAALPDFESLDPKALRMIHNLAAKAMKEGERAEVAEAKVIELEAVVVEMEPKVALADAVVEQGDNLDLDMAAEQLSSDRLIGRIIRKELIDHLVKKKRLYRKGKAQRLHVNRTAYDAGLMDVRYGEPWVDRNGKTRRSATPVMTSKGFALTQRELREERIDEKRAREREAMEKAQQLTFEARARAAESPTVEEPTEPPPAANDGRTQAEMMAEVIEASDLGPEFKAKFKVVNGGTGGNG